MKKVISVSVCLICLLTFALGVVGQGSSFAYVHVKNRANKYINPDGGVQMDGSNMSWKGTGLYIKDASEGYHTFCAKEGPEIKCRRSKVRPPSMKIVTIRFSRH